MAIIMIRWGGEGHAYVMLTLQFIFITILQRHEPPDALVTLWHRGAVGVKTDLTFVGASTVIF